MRLKFRVLADTISRLSMMPSDLAVARIRDSLARRREMSAQLDVDALDLSEATEEEIVEALGGGRKVVTKERILRMIEFRKRLYPKPAGLNSKLAPQETEALRNANDNGHVIDLSDDEIDVAIAGIHARAPWMREASTIALRGLRQSRGSGARVPPMILTGPPGTGKTSWSGDLAGALGVPVIKISATSRGVFSLVGLEAGWGSARPGVVSQTMIRTACGNPVVVIDEIEKAGGRAETSKGTSLPSLTEVLLDMTETSSAATWECPYFGVRLDLSRVSWVMTANAIDTLPPPLLDRIRVVQVDYPSTEELADLAYSRASGPAPVPFRSSESDALTKGDRKWQRHTATNSSGMRFASRSPAA